MKHLLTNQRTRQLGLWLLLLFALISPQKLWATNGTLTTTTIDSKTFYQIADAKDLAAFSNLVSARTDGSFYMDYNAILTADITWDATLTFNTIGVKCDNGGCKKYTGIFDGNGHTIHSLRITKLRNTGTPFCGMFAELNGATVKNLSLTDVDFNNDGGYRYDGLISGSATGSTLSNVYVEGAAKSGGYWSYAAGLVGTSSGCTYTNCGGNLVFTLIANNGTAAAGLVYKLSGTNTFNNCFFYGSFAGLQAGYYAYPIYAENTGTATFTNCHVVTFQGNYGSDYTARNTDTGITYKAQSVFASGEVAYLLNGSTNAGTWHQTIGTDNSPTLEASHGMVYRKCSEATYVNSNAASHEYNNGICTNCGAYQPCSGSGTSTDPYLIANAGNLIWFSNVVNNTNTGAWAKLTADIDMSSVEKFTPMALYSDDNSSYRKSYTGTFDGQGHTISNLKVYGPNTCEAGLFGRLQGTVQNLLLKNETVSGTLSTKVGGARLGGIAGLTYNGAVISCCGVVGLTITERDDKAKYDGGIVGAYASGSIAFTFTDYVHFFGTGSQLSIHTNCFENVSSTWKTSGELCWRLNGGAVTGQVWHQNLSGTVDAYPIPTATDHSTVYMKYADKTVSFTNTSTSITADQTVSIGSAYELHEVARAIVLGYTGKINVNQTADIDYSAYTGITDQLGAFTVKPYKGTYNGQYHKVTVAFNTNEDYSGLFRVLNGATIKNLHTTGTLTSSMRYNGGVAGGNSGAASAFENVTSDVKIICSYKGDITTGGLIGLANVGVTFKNCAFWGTFTGTDSYCWGGLCGWEKAGATITGCYVALNAASSYGNNDNNANNCTFTRGVATTTITNCYYLTAIGTAQGDAKTAAQFASGEVAYLLNGSQSAGTWRQKLSGSDVNTAPVLTQTDDNKVYYGYDGCEATAQTYANHALNATQGHNFVNNICTYCGGGHITCRVPTYNTDGDPKSGIKSWSIKTTAAKPVSASSTRVTWTAGWYYVSGNVTLNKGAVCSGAVHLILCDGATLTANGDDHDAGICVSGSNSLTIYAQSEGTGMGALSVTGGRYAAGIGGNSENSGQNITIIGGTITAKGGYCGAGIGGGWRGNGQYITIVGGKVTATGHSGTGAGIGGGYNGAGKDIAIVGGTVIAINGDYYPSAIGKGKGGSASNITIRTNLLTKAGTSRNSMSVITNNGGDLAGSLDGKLYVYIHKHPDGAPSWVWEADYTNATVTIPCSHEDEDVVLNTTTSPAVSITSTNTATCTSPGIITYKASVVINGITFTAPEQQVSAPALGHNWGEGVWTWAEDGKSATCTRTCQNDTSHTKEATVTLDNGITSAVTTPATCETTGIIKYTATATVEGTEYTDSKEITIPALGHDFDDDGVCTHEGCSMRRLTYLVPTYKTPGAPKSGIASWSTQTAAAKQVTSSSSTVTWTSGWYYVTGNVTLSQGAICSGAVHLILCDGATLTANRTTKGAGICVNWDNSLTIYAQSDGASKGSLTATGYDQCAAIGSSTDCEGRNITINGGNVTANAPSYAAAIGGSKDKAGRNIVINGGNVTALGSAKGWGPGIGGGAGGTCSDIIINGGSVYARGVYYAAGIGNGRWHPVSDIYINGGTVSAHGDGASAIGTGNAPEKVSSSIYIGNLGWVKADGAWNPTTVIANNGGDLASALHNIRHAYIHVHNCGEPTWEWAEDYSDITATFTTCSGCGDIPVLNKTTAPAVNITAVTTATCLTAGTTTYNASVIANGVTYNAPTAENISTAPLGHDYTAAWTWAEDGKSATCNLTCTRDASHTTSATASVADNTITSVVKTAATCTVMGTTTYTAKVTVEGKEYTDSKDVQDIAIDANAHEWGEGVWEWSADGKTATCTRTCAHDANHKSSVEATVENSMITQSETTVATCETASTTTYTAKVTVEGKEYTDAKVVEHAPALGHNYRAAWQWTEDGSDATLTITCQNDAAHTHTFTKANGVTITPTVSKAATCETAGEHTYTAACTYDNKVYNADSLVLADIPALGHSYDENGACTHEGCSSQIAGDGSAENPYLIYNADQLKWYADRVNATTANAGLSAELKDNIDLSSVCHAADAANGVAEVNWVPIGCPQTYVAPNYWNGTFNGNGYTISHLYISSNSNKQGLFGLAGSQSVITNLKMADVNVKGFYQVGAACGLSNGVIENLKLTNVNVEGYEEVGGACGNSYNSISLVEVVSGSVVATNEYVGGIVGASHKVKQCINRANVSGTKYVGGIVGTTYDNVENCSNYGTLYETQYGCVAGIVGNMGTTQTTIKNCANYGDIHTSATSYESGNPSGIVATPWTSYIDNCANFGNIYVATASDKMSMMVGYGYNYVSGAMVNSGKLYVNGVEQSNVPMTSRTPTKNTSTYYDHPTDLASGKYALILQSHCDTATWGQNITSAPLDTLPVLGAPAVYAGHLTCSGQPAADATYTNDANAVTQDAHQFVDGICSVCGALDPTYAFPAVDVTYTSSTEGFDYGWEMVAHNSTPTMQSTNMGVSSSTAGITYSFTSDEPFAVVYDWETSSEVYDKLWATADGAERFIYGESHMTTGHDSIRFEAGTHTLQFRYIKNDQTNYFDDRAYVSKLRAKTLCHDGHTLEATPAKDATCTEAGNTAYYHCTVCGKYFSDADGTVVIAADSWVIPATGHSYVEYGAKEATCTEAGNTAYKQCSVCGKYFDMEGNEIAENSWVIPVKAHTLVDVAYQAPTCTETGIIAHKQCSVCSKRFSDAAGTVEMTDNSWVIAATGHNTTHEDETAPTCTQLGNHEYWYCKNTRQYFKDEACTQLYKDTVDNGSNNGVWIAMVDHTYGEAVNGIQTCSVCGHQHAVSTPTVNSDTESPYHNWYAISTTGDVVWLREHANDSTVINAYLVNDIDLSPLCHPASEGVEQLNWEPIHYHGTFDGCNYTLSNLYYESEESTSVGLFINYRSGLSVKNLTVNGKISAPNGTSIGMIVGGLLPTTPSVLSNLHTNGVVEGNCAVGGIAGYIGYKDSTSIPVKVIGCSNAATVNAQYTVGGLVGTGFVHIDSCSNSGNVTATQKDNGYTWVGGLIGDQASYSNNNLLTLHASHNSGTIRGTGNDVGGLAGQTSAIIDTCYNTGAVIGESSYVGGITGNLHPADYNTLIKSVTHCSNTGYISGREYTGGLLGRCSTVRIDSLYNYGSVYSSASSGFCVGGVFGAHYGELSAENSQTVSHCYNHGTVTAASIEGVGGIGGECCAIVKYCSNTKDVIGTYRVGGIVGYQYSSKGNHVSYAGNCSNSGNITGYGSGDVGGIFGRHIYLVVDSCTNSGNVTCSNGANVGGIFGNQEGFGNPTISSQLVNCSNSGKVSGATSVGGIGGYSQSCVGNCHNTGAVSAMATYAGGITGIHITPNGQMLNYYSNCSNSGRIKGGKYVGGISGQTMAYSVSYLTNSGTVISNGTDGGYAGGIVGYVNLSGALSPIRYCTNTGDSVITQNGYYTGGIAGRNHGDVYRCKNSATVVNLSSAQYTGGIVGQNDSYDKWMNKISYCTNTGDVISSGGMTGGIAGESRATLDSLYNSGNILTTSGQGYIGGIVGNAVISTFEGARSHITHCVNEGDSVRSCGGHTAGIAGYNMGNLDDCRNTAHVFTTGSEGQVGGIVGKNDPYQSGEMWMNRIENCSSIGNVTSAGGYVGGIAGSTRATLDSLYHQGNVISTSGAGYVGGIVGKADQCGSYSHITHCVNKGDSVSSHGGYVGGITGYNQGNLDDCRNTAHVFSTSGSGYVGGIVGLNFPLDGSRMNSIENCSSIGDVISTGAYVGGIVGQSNAILDSLYHKGNVFSTGRSGYVGGIVGKADQCGDYSPITHCVNEGDSVRAGGIYVGGIAGYNQGNLYDCHNTSHVTTSAYNDTEGLIAYPSMVGGIVGSNDIYSGMNKIQNCSSIGNVTAPGGCIGGIAGMATASYDSLYHQGNVISTYKGPYVGGIVGYAYDNTDMDPDFFYCVNEGDSVCGKRIYVGGITGWSRGDFLHCHNTANVATEGTSDYASYIGGIVGKNETVVGHLNSIEDCYNKGNISAPGHCAGGLVGEGWYTFKKSYNTGDVTITELTNEVQYVGGLIGHAPNASEAPTITTCYNTGNITVPNGQYVGGLAGQQTQGRVGNCYSTGAVNCGTGSTNVGTLIGEFSCYSSSDKPFSDLYLLTGGVLPAVGTITEYRADMDTAFHQMSSAEFANGVVEYKLNGEKLTGNWGQQLGVDASPVLENKGIFYTRQMVNEWGTLVLPFELNYTVGNGDYKLFYLSSVKNDELSFTEYASGTIAAGTPMVLKAVGDKNLDDLYEVTFAAEGNCSTTITKTAPVGGLQMDGTYEQLTGKTGIYFIAQNQFWYAEAPVTIPAYRAWFEGTLPDGAPVRFSIVEVEADNGMVTELEEIGAAGNNDQAVKYIENDKLFIKKGGKVYNAAGQLVK